MSTTQQNDNKRRRVEAETTQMHSMRSDPYIGLDVGGRVFYCYRSTLTNTPGTLATRFGDDFSPGGHQYVDERGRTAYSVDRNPDVFQYVLDYLRTPSELPALLVGFGDNPELCKEADFFGLGHLAELLKVMYSCSPDLGDRGVLHWLGTGKGKHEYQNPFTLGAVHVGGWMDKSRDDLDPAVFSSENYHYAGIPESRASFVEYRPKVVTHPTGYALPGSRVFPCNFAAWDEAVIVDLRNILLKPSHYSLRHSGQCTDMNGDWNFEGSVDGQTWDVLHEARRDTNLSIRCSQIVSHVQQFFNELKRDINDKTVPDCLTSLMEQHYRKTWQLSTRRFYRYFRIIGKDKTQDKCLHCIGLELFGDICEM